MYNLLVNIKHISYRRPMQAQNGAKYSQQLLGVLTGIGITATIHDFYLNACFILLPVHFTV